MPPRKGRVSRAPVPAATPAATSSPPPAIRPEDHLYWARGIARAVRLLRGFFAGGQEEHELEAVAALILCQQAARFDFRRVPAGGDASRLFRGWSYQFIRTECDREAIRLRNGGTYHTRREKEHKDTGPIVVGSLPKARCGNCSALTLPAIADTSLTHDCRRPAQDPDDEPEEPVIPLYTDFEPHLVLINSKKPAE